MLTRIIGTRLVAHGLLRIPALKSPHKIVMKRRSEIFPPDQYDGQRNYWPKKYQFMYVMKHHWECMPLFIVTAAAMGLMVFSIFWAFRNKVDVMLTTGHRENISRTMDLRHPTTHKLFLINQRYLPWHEMQDVLDKMTLSEKRARSRLEACGAP